MKKLTFLIALILVFMVEIAAILIFYSIDSDNQQNPVTVNEAVQSVQSDWNKIEHHHNQTDLDYVVLDENKVIYKTKEGLSENINAAITHKDTILDIEQNGKAVGKITIYNDSVKTLSQQKQTLTVTFIIFTLVQCIICITYAVYLRHTVIKPFNKLKGFAEQVANGNLDIPLKMDKKNLFGAFTESFDIMRSELKKARIAEAEANASKKELVAKLSHDIKTPVASIKAASELGVALATDEKTRESYTQIILKTDQINNLVTNLFTATLEELRELSVKPTDMKSDVLKVLLENSDYLNRTAVPPIPDCLIYADKLRLQQVFDNIFANSYKYAGTDIDTTVRKDGNTLDVIIEDFGKGVSEDEIPYLKEKFKRGNNIKDIEGAGLGLYISDCFMKEMHGELLVENGHHGLKVTVKIMLSGKI